MGRRGRNRPTWRLLWLLAAVACLAVAAPLATTGPTAQAAPVTVLNGTQFTDPTGEPVHAHGGGVIRVGDYYYWFGENRNDDDTFRYVSAYRSTDLKTWEFRNHVLTQQSDPELSAAKIERPKVMYNEATGQFVMWAHKENATDYSEARAAVAVSDTVDGDYDYRGSFRPLGEHMSRDITVFVDDDGTGYMVSAANENYDLHIYRLTDDYTDVAELVANPWPGGHREAPALFKRNGVYFMLTSGATGWAPNQQQYATSTDIAEGWSEMRDVGDATAFDSQTAYVLPVQGTQTTTYLYLGDRWGGSFGSRVNDSRYVWLPLSFPDDRTMTMEWAPELTIDTAAGTVTAGGGPYTTLTARHSGKCVDVVSASQLVGAEVAQYGCNGGGNQHFWQRSAGDGHVQLVTRHSSLCLAVVDGSTSEGANVVQAPCRDGDQAQQWEVTDAGDGYVTLVARHSGRCLDVTDESTADGARLHQYTCSGAAWQQFLPEQV